MKKATPDQQNQLQQMQELLIRYKTPEAAHAALLKKFEHLPPSMAGQAMRSYRLALSTTQGQSALASSLNLAKWRDLMYQDLLPNWDKK